MINSVEKFQISIARELLNLIEENPTFKTFELAAPSGSGKSWIAARFLKFYTALRNNLINILIVSQHSEYWRSLINFYLPLKYIKATNLDDFQTLSDLRRSHNLKFHLAVVSDFVPWLNEKIDMVIFDKACVGIHAEIFNRAKIVLALTCKEDIDEVGPRVLFFTADEFKLKIPILETKTLEYNPSPESIEADCNICFGAAGKFFKCDQCSQSFCDWCYKRILSGFSSMNCPFCRAIILPFNPVDNSLLILPQWPVSHYFGFKPLSLDSYANEEHPFFFMHKNLITSTKKDLGWIDAVYLFNLNYNQVKKDLEPLLNTFTRKTKFILFVIKT